MKTTKKDVTKSVTIKLTRTQQALLEKETKGVFRSATFSFPEKPIRPPKHKVSCVLDRVAAPTKE